jgi:phosphonate transport system substrate-binding protein
MEVAMIFNTHTGVGLIPRLSRSIVPALTLVCTLFYSWELGRSQELRFAVTDIVGLEELQTEYGAFQRVLSEVSGVELRFFPVSNRTAAVESLKAQKIDLVLTGPAEYVIFRSRTNAYPVAGFSRPDYFSGLIAMTDRGIDSVKELKGKKVAFGDVGSTSKHLAPMQLLKDAGVDPLKYIQAQHVSTNIGWEALKRGDVAAFGMTYSNYLSLRDKDKQEPGAFRVIARGPDLPHDPLVAAAHVDKKVIDKLKAAFQSHSRELIAAILNGKDTQKYKGMKFITRIDDRDYDVVRSMYLTIGHKQFATFVGGN